MITEPGAHDRFEAFLVRLEKLADGDTEGKTLIMDDPLANSFLQNPYAPDPDPNMTVEEYDRTYDQNEAYGLNDIDTEDHYGHEEIDSGR